ncbi:BQ2448_1611 [Microbotryum intermedium]|uniref:BQ2448_1611 protein n=1 Tax=Microbotryum intermedium TaxID=269621 RepID=A0A238FAL8_9BASI|nr:BQ2448_1611 [Microbotryum intermedium]
MLGRGRRAFSSTHPLRATLSNNSELKFPTTPCPTPFEIFHLSPKDPLTTLSVKARYYELCKLYHPDLQQQQQQEASTSTKGKGKGKAIVGDPPQRSSTDTSSEFKQIVAAYELLRNPTRRAAYLHSGEGWTTPSTARGFRNANGDAMGYPVHFRRGRPMASSTTRPTYSSSAYDWHMSGAAASGWTDPYNSFWSSHPRAHTRPGRSSGSGPASESGSAPDLSSSGWKHQGHIGRNGTIFLALATLTMFTTPLAVWSSSPTLTTSTESGWMPVVQDRRHRDASLALETARKEARKDSEAKREAIKRRVQQIEYARAIDRADQLERIASGRMSTGHDQLPRPRRSAFSSTQGEGAMLALAPTSSPPSSSSGSSNSTPGVS